MMSCHRIRFLLVLAFVVPAVGQAPARFTSLAVPSETASRSLYIREHHLRGDQLGALYSSSAFAHGYRHGYDQGFHVGDLDIHMGREARIALKVREYRQSAREFHETFGSKQLFQEGFQAGFRSGYSDAIAGLEYRAGERSKAAAAGLSTALPPTVRHDFDEGFASGYKSAQSQNAPAERITAEYVNQYCQKMASRAHPLEYCSGFSRGYLLGIFDAPSMTSKVVSSSVAGH